MKFVIKNKWLASIILYLASSYSLALTPGQIDFTDLSKHYGDARVEVNLSKGIIGMVSSMSKHSDIELAKMLEKLELVKIRIYDLKGDFDKANSVVNRISASIKKQQWENIVTVNENNEKVRVFTQSRGNKIGGIVVMVISSQSEQGGEAVFINIVGEIDPENIGKVSQSLNIKLPNIATPGVDN